MYNSNQIYGNYGVNPYYNYVPQQNNIYRNTVLQGKTVDNIEVVKATDISMDGSISYFPFADGSAIATKQLQQDGTSKIIIYKPSTEKETETPKYVTETDVKEQIKDINGKDIKDIKEELKSLKRKVEDITDELKDKKEK